MLQAIKESKIAAQNHEVPVGAVIVKNNVVISKAHNKTQENNIPTAHAEILAIEQACKRTNAKYLNGCDIYVTLEPCHMCIAAISLARIDRVFFSLNDSKFGGLDSSDNNFLYLGQKCYKKPKIYKDTMGKNVLYNVQEFFQQLRNN